MIPYKEYEKTVYEWLMSKHKADSTFTFSTRMNGLKGSELDYFIGTEKSGYFGLTFWSIPVGFPGSAGDLIDVFFKQKKDGFKFDFVFGQTMFPSDEQNTSALNLIKNIKEEIRALGEFTYETTADLKMFKYALRHSKPRYLTLDELFVDLEKTLNAIIPIVENGINEQKELNPNFIAQRISLEQFQEINEKLNKRFIKYNIDSDNFNDKFNIALSKHNQSDLNTYFDFLRLILKKYNLKQNDERLFFSVTKNNLNFTIGQRYCWNLFASEKKGKFGVISKNVLNQFSEEFSGFGVSAKAFYTHFSEFTPTEEQLKSIFSAIDSELKRTNKSSFLDKKNIDFENYSFEFVYANTINKVDMPLNQILYGPPGTGKTYISINKAISIINPEFDLNQNRKIIKAEFDRLIGEGQIVFTTFHQNMSYEDFIEGIKPKVDEDSSENKQVTYEIEDGIFKQLVEKAKQNKSTPEVHKNIYGFEDAWDCLINEGERNIESASPLILTIQTPNLGMKIVEITERGNLKLIPIYSENANEYIVSFSRAKKLHEAFPDLSLIKNIDKEFRAVIGGSNSTAYWSILNYINQKITLNYKDDNYGEVKSVIPHVIIIDEINRGNVSSIFGELITLIEDSKRIGEPEELEVILPYSKMKFGVPSNIYIIGTMNTADRSIEALDTALRRRFSFTEMQPKPELILQEGKLKSLNGKIDDIDVVDILKVMNDRIEKLIDKDHKIGHSYFLGIETLDDLKQTFKDKVIPLLEEYFFGDFGKISLVLGSSFISKSNKSGVSFAKNNEYDPALANDLIERDVYEITSLDNWDFKAIYQ
jgi:hypothetical protein